MDFYVDLAIAVLLRLVKDKRSVARYYVALAKVFLTLRNLTESDEAFRKIVREKDAQP